MFLSISSFFSLLWILIFFVAYAQNIDKREFVSILHIAFGFRSF